MKIRCLVVDDEQLARELLKDYISRIPALELVAMCRNPLEAIEYIESGKIDLILLDIQMPELTGTKFLSVYQNLPAVIFTTAYPEYALEGYELNVLDYLVKPFSFERFIKAINKAFPRIRSDKAVDGPAKQYISVNADHKIYRINLDDILYIEGLKEYVSFYTREKRIITLASMKNLESTLPPNSFMRVHKSYIVSLKNIRTMEGNLLDIGVKKIPVGRSYRDEVIKRLFQ